MDEDSSVFSKETSTAHSPDGCLRPLLKHVVKANQRLFMDSHHLEEKVSVVTTSLKVGGGRGNSLYEKNRFCLSVKLQLINNLNEQKCLESLFMSMMQPGRRRELQEDLTCC